MKGDWSKTTWMARGEYDLTDSVMMYLSYETGWKSGVLQDGKGYDDLVTSGGTLDFSRNNSLLQKPEEVDSIELGIKTDFRDWRLSANVFYMDFSDMQVTGAVIDPVTGQSTLTNTNAGGATIKGLELEASAGLFNDGAGSLRPSRLWMRRMTSSSATNRTSAHARAALWNNCAFGWSRAVPVSATCSTSLATTCRMRRKYQLTVQYSHEFPLPGGAGSGAAHSRQLLRRHVPRLGEPHRSTRGVPLSPTDPGERDFGLQSAYTMVDAAIAFRSSTDQWTAEAFITNASMRPSRPKPSAGRRGRSTLGPAPPRGASASRTSTGNGRQSIRWQERGTSRSHLRTPGTVKEGPCPFYAPDRTFCHDGRRYLRWRGCIHVPKFSSNRLSVWVGAARQRRRTGMLSVTNWSPPWPNIWFCYTKILPRPQAQPHGDTGADQAIRN